MHTKATKMAMDDMGKVIDSFSQDTPFMSKEMSPRSKSRQAALASAPADIRGLLDEGYSKDFVMRMMKAQEEK